MSTNTYHVTFYYLATGMEGIPMTRDHGSISAYSEKEAIDKVISRQYAHLSDNDRGFTRGCLSAMLLEEPTSFLNLYLISQDENNDYDTYDSAVVAASTDEIARNTHPGISGWGSMFRTWASSPDKVEVELIGTTDKQYSDGEIVLSSYNAG